MTVHCCWPNDGGVWENTLNPLFTLKLGTKERGRGVWRSIQVGKLHKTLDPSLRSELRDPFRASDMDVSILEVPVKPNKERTKNMNTRPQ
jgi:hypothetical protein